MASPYKDFIHPVDKAATEAVRSVPGFDALCKKITEVIDEKSFKLCATASMVKLGPNQYPDLYNKIFPICERLQIEPPEVYLGWNGTSECQVFGDTKTFLIINAGIFWSFTEDEVEVALAQACGHILCRHALYYTIAEVINQVGEKLVGGIISSTILKGVNAALQYWIKCSNFSADSVAVYYYKDARRIVEMLAKYAGGAPCVPGKINLDEFINQGRAYRELLDKSNFNKVLTVFNPLSPDHPLATYRAASAVDFFESFNFEEFERLTHQESVKKITEGGEKKCNIEISFSNVKTTGIQFLASKVRSVINSDVLHVDIHGVAFEIAPNKNWTNVLNSRTYNIIFKTHNRRSEYTLHLLENTHLIVEWDDKKDVLLVKEEPLVVPEIPEIDNNGKPEDK